MPPNPDIQELLRLTRDNNRLLHKMHRSAVWGGIIKFALYVILLVVVPFWLYSTYLAPIMEQMLETYSQIQGTGAKAQAQFSDIQKFFQQFKETVSPQ